MNKRRTLIAVVIGISLALFAIIRAWPGPEAAQEPADTSAESDTRHEGAAQVATHARSGVEPRPAATSGDSAPAGTETTPVEQDLVFMYEEMVGAFRDAPGNCSRMGGAIREITRAHETTLVEYQRERAGMTPDEYARAQRRLEAAMGEQLEDLRHEVEQAVAHCKQHKGLHAALRNLAATGVTN